MAMSMNWRVLFAALAAPLLLGPDAAAARGLPPRAVATHVGQAPELSPRAEVARETLALSGPRPATLSEAEMARRSGAYDGAAAVLRLLSQQPNPTLAHEALLQLAVVLLEGGRTNESADAARELLARNPEPASQSRATFLLGRAKRAIGDCPAALASWGEVERLGSELGPYLDLKMAECHARLGDRAAQADRAARSVSMASARLTRIEGLEYEVDAALKRGDPRLALRLSERLLHEAGTRAYRAQTLASTARIQLSINDREVAASTLALVVAELPETAAAAAALDSLIRMDAVSRVGADQVGLVHHFHNRHQEAVAAIYEGAQQELPPDRATAALYYAGSSLARLERVDDAVGVLRQVAANYPTSELAPRALLRAGRALESAGRLADASELFREAADGYPDAAAGQEAHQRLISGLFRRGALPETIAAAGDLAGRGGAASWKGLGLLWSGKAFARAGDRGQAEQAWRRAADLDPDDFGGLRARAILEGDAGAVATARLFDPSVLEPTDADRAELDRWLAQRGLDSSALSDEQAADANYKHARELFRLGLREEARWELQEIGTRFAADPARLFWLARFAHERGEAQLGMRLAVDARKVTGLPLAEQPKLLQRLIFPLPFADLIVGHASRRGIDPLLFAALVRQESAFNAAARSSAGALGLAQVMPPTGQEIARGLGRSDFTPDELLRPIVSVEFGVSYLSTQLKAYDGRVFPALAAYNAGGGAANRWLREFGDPDPDVWAEQIPYAETNHYVQVVYENYRLYRRLYGS